MIWSLGFWFLMAYAFGFLGLAFWCHFKGPGYRHTTTVCMVAALGLFVIALPFGALAS